MLPPHKSLFCTNSKAMQRKRAAPKERKACSLLQRKKREDSPTAETVSLCGPGEKRANSSALQQFAYFVVLKQRGRSISAMRASEMAIAINAALVLILATQIRGSGALGPCRSFCGNVTIAYPFGIDQGCGHPQYRDLLYCINNVVMLHISSGSYQVVSIDYGFRELALFDPKMSTCSSMHKSDGFVLEENRSLILKPTPDNVLMLLGCPKTSPLFKGKEHLPCQNVSGMGCQAFYSCPSWVGMGNKERDPPLCCGVPFNSIGAVNITHLQCYSYSSAYSSAPLQATDPRQWSYGIQVSYTVPQDYDLCKSCEASRGLCGYDVDKGNNLCLCDGWNSTSSCELGSGSAANFPMAMYGVGLALLAGIILLSTF